MLCVQEFLIRSGRKSLYITLDFNPRDPGSKPDVITCVSLVQPLPAVRQYGQA